eukprot:2034671-Amphidinium_carterae.1
MLVHDGLARLTLVWVAGSPGYCCNASGQVDLCQTTHADPRCVASCVLVTSLVTTSDDSALSTRTDRHESVTETGVDVHIFAAALYGRDRNHYKQASNGSGL